MLMLSFLLRSSFLTNFFFYFPSLSFSPHTIFISMCVHVGVCLLYTSRDCRALEIFLHRFILILSLYLGDLIILIISIAAIEVTHIPKKEVYAAPTVILNKMSICANNRLSDILSRCTTNVSNPNIMKLF